MPNLGKHWTKCDEQQNSWDSLQHEVLECPRAFRTLSGMCNMSLELRVAQFWFNVLNFGDFGYDVQEVLNCSWYPSCGKHQSCKSFEAITLEKSLRYLRFTYYKRFYVKRQRNTIYIIRSRLLVWPATRTAEEMFKPFTRNWVVREYGDLACRMIQYCILWKSKRRIWLLKSNLNYHSIIW